MKFSNFAVNVRDVYQRVSNAKQIFDSIPKILKSNIEFFVNMANVKTYDGKSSYVDDCGEWNWISRSYHYDYYLKRDFKIIYKKNNIFYYRKVVKGERGLFKCDPQPNESEIFSVTRISNSHQLDPAFIRKIAIVYDITNPKVDKIAFFQYCGSQPLESTKLRTDVVTMNNLKKNRHEKTKSLYADDQKNIKNTKVISNMKYREKVRNNEHNSKSTIDNIEDLSLKVGNGFVRLNFRIDSDIPAFVLYSDDQIADLTSNSKDVIIGIDRTFNLGPYFLTVFSFKNQKVIRRATQENPIFIGPMILHKKATYDVYHLFFAHIASKMGQTGHIALAIDERVDFGSDQEKSIVKAIDDVFPRANRFLCCLHLIKNFSRYVDGLALTKSEKKDLKYLFEEPNGILASEDDYDFNQKVFLI